MKRNTEDLKLALEKALTNVPDDFALSEVRFHIRAALGLIEHVESKRDRRTTLQQKKAAAVVNTYDPFRAIQAIEEEIAKEKTRLESIKSKKNQIDQKDTDDEFQTVFG